MSPNIFTLKKKIFLIGLCNLSVFFSSAQWAFSPDKVLPFNPGVNTTNAMTFTGMDYTYAYATGAHLVLSSDVYYNMYRVLRSTDDGITWTQVATGTGSAVKVDADGVNVLVLCKNGTSLITRYSSNAGASWGGTLTVATGSPISVLASCIDGTKSYVAYWVGGIGSNFSLKRSIAGAAYSSASTVTLSSLVPGGLADMTANCETLHVSWNPTSQSNLSVTRFTVPATGTPTPSSVTTTSLSTTHGPYTDDGGIVSDMNLTLGFGGITLHLTYQNRYYRSINNGLSWSLVHSPVFVVDGSNPDNIHYTKVGASKRNNNVMFSTTFADVLLDPSPYEYVCRTRRSTDGGTTLAAEEYVDDYMPGAPDWSVNNAGGVYEGYDGANRYNWAQVNDDGTYYIVYSKYDMRNNQPSPLNFDKYASPVLQVNTVPGLSISENCSPCSSSASYIPAGITPTSYSWSCSGSTTGTANNLCSGNCNLTVGFGGSCSLILPLYISSCLPVELASFYGNQLEDCFSYSLYWETESERENSYFVIQRMIGDIGDSWKDIGKVSGNQNSTTNKKYYFEDLTLSLQNIGVDNKIYYRLKQVDANGNYVYSDIIQFSCNTEEFNVFPNPTTSNFFISNPYEGATFIIYDQLGQVVEIVENSPKGVLIPQKEISNGMYIIELNYRDKMEKKNVIKI